MTKMTTLFEYRVTNRKRFVALGFAILGLTDFIDNTNLEVIPDFVFATLNYLEEEKAKCIRPAEDSEQTKSDRS